jgi:hypothetical protein
VSVLYSRPAPLRIYIRTGGDSTYVGFDLFHGFHSQSLKRNFYIWPTKPDGSMAKTADWNPSPANHFFNASHRCEIQSLAKLLFR